MVNDQRSGHKMTAKIEESLERELMKSPSAIQILGMEGRKEIKFNGCMMLVSILRLHCKLINIKTMCIFVLSCSVVAPGAQWLLAVSWWFLKHEIMSRFCQFIVRCFNHQPVRQSRRKPQKVKAAQKKAPTR